MRKKLKFLLLILPMLAAVCWPQAGTTPQVHGVTLYWNGPAIGSGADGYNVYSQPAGAPGFARLNSSPVVQTLATCPALPGLTSPCFTYNDSTVNSLAGGTVVQYEVLTTLGGVEAPPDGPVNATTVTLPKAATGLADVPK